MQVTLGSALGKLAHATKHKDVLADKAAALSGSARPHMYPITADGYREGLEYRFHLGRIPPFNAEDFALGAGDCLFNLGATLDHIVYALHVNGRAKMTPAVERASQFPILTEDAFKPVGTRFTDTKTWNEIKRLNARQRKAVEILQPYYRRDKTLIGLREALGELQRLNNIDKHRRLHVVRHVVLAVGVPQFPPEYGFRFDTPDVALESEAEVLRWTFASVPPDITKQVQMNRYVVAQVSLAERGTYTPLVPYLEYLISAVTQVLARFNPFFS